MRIIYFANHNNPNPGDKTEEHITYSLQKLGHEVIRVHESTPGKLNGIGADLFLFHKGGPNILTALQFVTCPKVCWYFDKIWNGRDRWMAEIIPLVDMVAMTDEAWARRNPNEKIKIVRQGIGDGNLSRGKQVSTWTARIAFLGSTYGKRQEWVRKLQKRYPGEFGAFNDVFNRTLFDFCETISVIVAPPWPSEDYYWSSRIYITIGSGGFLIHPRLKGLEYEDGVHYAGYETEEEMFDKIDYYLLHDKEREKIRLAGYEKTIIEFTYTNRVSQLLTAYESLPNRSK